MKQDCNPSNCPIPICNLPEVLTALQIKTVMTFMRLGYKVLATDLNMSISRIYQILNYEEKNPTNLKKISDYLRKKLVEKLNLDSI